VTHRFAIDQAVVAYELVKAGAEPYLGIAFDYPETAAAEGPIVVHRRGRGARTGGAGVGLIGAGAFASAVLVPAIKAAGFGRLVAVTSASGLSARRLADRAGFEKAVSGADAVLNDPDVDAVVIGTPHDLHAGLAAAALRAGKHVFCEKPLALTLEELADVESAFAESTGELFVGFNRRWSDAVGLATGHFAGGSGPLVITYRVSAGTLPAKHWYNDRRQGGRLLGEVCHFVDTCAAIVGRDATDVHAMAVGTGETLLADDLVVTLRYPEGSLATISYASGGHSSTEKERIDVLGRGRSAAIVDFRQVLLDGRQAASGSQDKGHFALMKAFAGAVRTGDRGTAAGLASTRTTLLAAASLTGRS